MKDLIHFDPGGKIKLSMRGRKYVLSMPAALREILECSIFSREKLQLHFTILVESNIIPISSIARKGNFYSHRFHMQVVNLS
jgi:hypothetical protein